MKWQADAMTRAAGGGIPGVRVHHGHNHPDRLRRFNSGRRDGETERLSGLRIPRLDHGAAAERLRHEQAVVSPPRP